MRLNFRIKQGLGDNAQFSICLKHIKHYYPDSYIAIQAPWGTEDIYRGLVNHWQPIRYPWLNHGFDKSIYIHFAHPLFEWSNLPSSKATQCLLEELPPHGLDMEPIEELFAYNVVSTDEQKNKVGEWLETLPDNKGIVYFHPNGNSKPQEKDLDSQSWCTLYHELRDEGYLPIHLNWRNPEHGMERFIKVGEFRGDRVEYSDAGQIMEILNAGMLLIGIDSGVEHIASVSNCPTAVIWKNHHPLFCFDLEPNDQFKHFLPCHRVEDIEGEDAKKYFDENYNYEYFDSNYALFSKIKSWFIE